MDGNRDFVKVYEALKTERTSLDGMYDLIDRFVVPGRGKLYGATDENAIDWLQRERYDSTAITSALTLAASLASSLTSFSTTWFEYRWRDPRLNEDHDCRVWMENASRNAFYGLNESNFATEVAELYLDLVAFGTPGLLHDYTTPNSIVNHRFKSMPVRSFYFETDYAGNVIALYRLKDFKPDQMYLEFGPDRLPEKIKQALQDPSRAATENHEVLHVIYLDAALAKAAATKDNTKPLGVDARPFQEKYILLSTKEELFLPEKNSYYEMPAYIPRWGTIAGSKFGYSPAINSMPDILSLNRLVYLIFNASERALEPPLLAVDRGVLSDINLGAGQVTKVRTRDALTQFINGARVDVGQVTQETLVRAVRQAFFVDQLELKESPAMTATEVNVRYELMQRLLGPAANRIKTDFLDKLLRRTFFSMLREGQLGALPEAAKGEHIEVEYIGPLARHQKLDTVVAIERMTSSLNNIAGVMGADQTGETLKDAISAFDWPETLRDLADGIGFPAKNMKPKAKVLREAQDRKAAQDKANQMGVVGQMVETMKTGAEAAKLSSEAGIDLSGAAGGMM